jgi:MFS transporter, ACS family, D-galactonate transporter
MGIVAPVTTGYVVGLTNSFSGAFLIAGVVLLIGIVSYVVLLGRVEPIPDQETPDAGSGASRRAGAA